MSYMSIGVLHNVGVLVSATIYMQPSTPATIYMNQTCYNQPRLIPTYVETLVTLAWMDHERRKMRARQVCVDCTVRERLIKAET